MRREAQSHKLNHENIVKMYAMVMESGHCGIVLEYVRHGDLKVYIAQNTVGYSNSTIQNR